MTDDGLGQVQTAVAAASATTDSTTLTDTLDTLLLMESEPTVILTAETMTAEATKELSASTMTIASAPDAELQTVNETSRVGRPPKPGKGNSGAAYFEAATTRTSEGESVQLWIARTRDTDTLTVDYEIIEDTGYPTGDDDGQIPAKRRLGGFDLWRLPGPERQDVLRRAIVDGTRIQMRSILLTSGTTIAGLLPLLYKKDASQGKDIWENLALSSIGGLGSSTVLILSAIPALYWIFTRWGWGFARFGRWTRRKKDKLAPAPAPEPSAE